MVDTSFVEHCRAGRNLAVEHSQAQVVEGRLDWAVDYSLLVSYSPDRPIVHNRWEDSG